MSGFEAEFERLRREVEDTISRILELEKMHSSRLSEIESRVGLADSKELGELLGEVKGLRGEVKDELLKAKGELFRELRGFRDRLREASATEPARSRELKESFEELKEFFEDSFEEAEDRLEEFSDRVEAVEDEIRDRIRELRREVERETYVMRIGKPSGVGWGVELFRKTPKVKIHTDIGRLVEESLSKAWRGSMIVSSVRLPKTDLDLIDALVEAGLFRSRNDAIAFFAHKGIEASEDWLRSVKDKVGEIKKLQEETRRELERMLSEAPKTSEEKGEEEKKEG